MKIRFLLAALLLSFMLAGTASATEGDTSEPSVTVIQTTDPAVVEDVAEIAEGVKVLDYDVMTVAACVMFSGGAVAALIFGRFLHD